MKDLSALGYTAATLDQVEEFYSALLKSLKRDVDRTRPGVVLARLGRSEGYLRNVWHGRSSISLRRFLEVIEATGSSPMSFFEKSLDTTPSAKTFLFSMESELGDRRLPDALREVVVAGLEGSSQTRRTSSFDPEEAVEKLTAKTPAVQRRLLLRTRRFRQVEFLTLYLAHLDELRFDFPQQVSRLAETVALKLSPVAYGGAESSRTLFCSALRTSASADRIAGHLARAAAVLRIALEAAGEESFKAVRAQLLVCASSVLRDGSQPRRGLLALREAQEIYFDLGETAALGQVQVQRAILYNETGAVAESLRCYQRALELMPNADRSLRRWRLACHQGAAMVHYRLNQLDKAEACLAEARGESSGESHHNLAKLLWLEGKVAFQRDEQERAEHLLHRAWGLFSSRKDPRALLVQLDQIEALLLRGRVFQAHELANHVISCLLSKPELSSIRPLAKDLRRTLNHQRLTVALIREAQSQAQRLLS